MIITNPMDQRHFDGCCCDFMYYLIARILHPSYPIIMECDNWCNHLNGMDDKMWMSSLQTICTRSLFFVSFALALYRSWKFVFYPNHIMRVFHIEKENGQLEMSLKMYSCTSMTVSSFSLIQYVKRSLSPFFNRFHLPLCLFDRRFFSPPFSFRLFWPNFSMN